MKSIKLTDIMKLTVTDVPKPEIKKTDDVLIKVQSVGVCGSDIHYFKEGRIGSQVIDFPFTIGHEMAGIVESVGPGVASVKPGQRIIVDPLMACYDCSQCKTGRYHTCENQIFLGCPGQSEGCLSEFVIMPEACCYQIPEGMSFESGVLCEPLAIGLYAVTGSVPLHGKTAAIIGSGPIGLSVMLGCRYSGAAGIFMTDKLDYRCATAAGHGATWAGNPLKEDIVKIITDENRGPVDVVFECCGQQEALDQAMSIVKPGGKIMIIGIPEFERYSFMADVARRKEITIQHVRRQNEHTQVTVDRVAAQKIDPLFMVTHQFHFSESQEAFELVAGYNDNVIKAVIQF